MDTFYESGGNYIDTANMYMAGETEEWLGQWMSARGNRDDLVVATKYTQPWRMPFMEPADSKSILSNYGGSNKKSLRTSLETSLRRLQTDYVDILYVHAWEPTSPIPELMRALDNVVRQGKALYLGVCNWPAWVVASANAYARANGITPFVVYQGRWNAAEREIEREIVPMCKAEGMGIAVWSALGGGKFKTEAERQIPGGRVYNGDFLGTKDDSFQQVFPTLERIAQAHSTTPTSIALRFVMQKVSGMLLGSDIDTDHSRNPMSFQS
jgi:aryl-alcohol dehydrogenase-like predicted oxidoreductase